MNPKEESGKSLNDVGKENP